MECIKIVDPRKKVVLFLSDPADITRERKAYLAAFEQNNVTVVCVKDTELKRTIANINNDIICILYPDPCNALIPDDILQYNIPTACFQIDAYDGTAARFRQSMLFDYAFIFHPEYDELLKKQGHSGAILLPHAVETNLYPSFNKNRTIEVGWVGRLDGSFYKNRKEQVEAISRKFTMNNIFRFYNRKELIEVYTNSKIAVNISRDDYMIDANLRCFEIMASGALLLTKMPTELTALPLNEGEHFVGYTDTENLLAKIEYYLEHDSERIQIALNGYKAVNEKHDFYHRAAKIIELIQTTNHQKIAPAKSWNKQKVNQVLFEYYSHRRILLRTLKYGFLVLFSRYTKPYYVFKNIARMIFLNFKFYIK
ncbi:glycosyltransferase family protein [Zunongwangia sp.]|uniref:glycosyltransferase family protein n=1 Tax=Zunongwangia sp. TaxID=1965325 RepID=UPI003AA7F8DB